MVSAAQQYWLRRRRDAKPQEQVLTADLQDVTADINVLGKFKGKLVMDLDTLVAYQAQGEADSDAWRPVGVFDGSGDINPA